jgi:putative glutamine amidotransferase
MKPKIGVTMAGGGGQRRLCEDYVEAVYAAGGVALALPHPRQGAAAAELLEGCQGLLLSGGGDIHGDFFGEPLHPRAEAVDPCRDAFEIALCRRAVAQNIPLLGICRGVQVLNVALGGGLVQHLEGHARPEARGAPAHPVAVAPGSLLWGLYGPALEVNTLHHQGVGPRLGEGLRVTARGPEGWPEALEGAGRFLLGVQWHPEALWENFPEHLKLFAAFVEACAVPNSPKECGHA